MAGHGNVTYEAHEFLAAYAPDRFSATAAGLLSCIDAIDERVVAMGEISRNPALDYGIATVQTIRERLENDTFPVFMNHDDLRFQLTHNLGGLGLTEGSIS